MTTVEKVTVSLPAELFARIERRRQQGGTSRSEVVSELLWRGWRQLEEEDREERYRAAYKAQPDTGEELAWADMAADELFADDDRMDIGEPDMVIEVTPSEEMPSNVEAVKVVKAAVPGAVKKSAKTAAPGSVKESNKDGSWSKTRSGPRAPR
jgi:Arc/MetJ-type ribon-helix-helix transcriptional regulator